FSDVSTFSPLSTSLLPTAAPIMPGAITVTTGVMDSSQLSFRGAATSREPGIHNPGAGVMDSGLAALWQSGMTRFTPFRGSSVPGSRPAGAAAAPAHGHRRHPDSR